MIIPILIVKIVGKWRVQTQLLKLKLLNLAILAMLDNKNQLETPKPIFDVAQENKTPLTDVKDADYVSESITSNEKLLPKTGEEESYQLIWLAVAFFMASIMIKVKQKIYK